MNEKRTNGYFFISHSSQDIEQVRKIRNVIEEENGNPILFYLKCLDGDNPKGKDKEELKSLISREILARKKFIFCKSKYTDPPLVSEWITWEKNEVERLRTLSQNNKIQTYTIEIENNDKYLEQVKEIVCKQNKILLISPHETINQCSKMGQYLRLKKLNIEILYETGEMRDELTKWNGQYTKEIVKNKLALFNIEQKGIIVIFNAKEYSSTTFLQMIYTFTNHHQNFILPITVNKEIQLSELQELYIKISTLINS